MSIFEFSDYRPFLKAHFAKSKNKGRGQLLALARFLRIHPTVVSQVFSGLREFSEEQAIEIGERLELTPLETKFLRTLVRHSSAGSPKLRAQLKLELEEMRKESQSLATRVPVKNSLTDTERAIFYSSWIYSAIRLFCSTSKKGKTVDEITANFEIPRPKTIEITQFLTQTGLLTYEEEHFQMGSQSTFVDRNSPFLPKHLLNWRLKATQTLDRLASDELMYSGPCSISRQDFAKIREELADVIKKFAKTVETSEAEEIACLNIDFFRVMK